MKFRLPKYFPAGFRLVKFPAQPMFLFRKAFILTKKLQTGLRAMTSHGPKNSMLLKLTILTVRRQQVPAASGTRIQKDANLRFKLPAQTPMRFLQVLQAPTTRVFAKTILRFWQTEATRLPHSVHPKLPELIRMLGFLQEASLA